MLTYDLRWYQTGQWCYGEPCFSKKQELVADQSPGACDQAHDDLHNTALCCWLLLPML